MLEGDELGQVGLEKAGDAVEGLVSEGVNFFEAVQETAEKVQASIMELADPAKELASRLGELAEGTGKQFGEVGEQIGQFLHGALELVQRGSEWLLEHPEVVEAAVRLGVLGVYGFEHPDQFLRLLEEQPGAIEDLLRSFEPLLETIE